jgi:putative hydrolase of HD superfamily
MCLVHDLPESRLGDLNSVQKQYVTPDEAGAVAHQTEALPWGAELTALMNEFNAGRTAEARLARDADQLALVLDLKHLSDVGYRSPDKWLPAVLQRLRTRTGRQLAEAIMARDSDAWWLKNLVDRHTHNKIDD